MKEKILLFIILPLWFAACNAQDQDKQEKDKTIPKPQTNVKVNKEYDDAGNLIRYDSVYTSYYSNTEGDSLLQDSIMEVFRQMFGKSYHFSEKPFFNDLFFNDTLLMYDFYKNDFFEKRFEYNRMMMNQLFREMDSVKNAFFKQQNSALEDKQQNTDEAQ